MKKIYLMILACLFILTSCKEANTTSDKPTIMTTVYPVSYITEYIVQDTVNVQSIYPKGADIHEYELTTRDIQSVLEADYLFAISEQMETFIPTIKQSIDSGESKVELLLIADQKLLLDSIEEDQYYDKENNIIQNYHFWTSPKKALIVNEIIYDRLIEEFPQNKDLYTKNYNNLKAQLKSLEQQYEQIDTNKIFYVTHDAYYWLIQDYKLDIRAMQGSDEHHEASTKEIKEIVDTINEKDIETIYAEKNDENNKLIQTISEQTSASVKYLNNFEVELEEEDYIQGLKNNLEEFKR